MTETSAYPGFSSEMNAAPPSFVIELTEFSGPLDLLLTLIRDCLLYTSPSPRDS